MKWFRRQWAKTWFKVFSIFLLLILTLFVLRYPILRGIGNYLYAADELQKSDAVFVLGGNSFERGVEAAKVYEKYPGVPIYSTGSNIPLQLLAFDTSMTEAELTTMLLKKNGVPDSLAIAFKVGTSTREEATSICAMAKEKGYSKIVIISSTFHLRRVKQVFESVSSDEKLTFIFHGAPSKDFDPNSWWKHEEGLITVNNELMKMLYYFIS
ncbi:MAG: YdcF family protein [Flavobacteriales bacterium]|nr:YdcF family protein [Flavobacteriales bacterium]